MLRGCTGLAQGSPQNMLDVCDLLAQIWRDFNPATICRCWIASGILFPDQEAILDEHSRGSRTATLGRH
eukprot:2477582-Rhodomonas_salina.1